MKCTHCGTELNSEYAFCTTCGAPTKSSAAAQVSPPPLDINYRQVPPAPISAAGWLGRMLIPIIPIVGPVIYFIMLFVWMSDTTKEASFRNFAKAQLILIAICLVLVLFAFVLFGGLFLRILPSLY